jgi:hypothetical protein
VSTLQVGTAEIEIGGKPKRFLVFDNEAFDYELSEEDLSKAVIFCGTDGNARKALNGEIQTHFLACLGEFLGWEIKLPELIEAIRTGQLEKKGEATCTS